MPSTGWKTCEHQILLYVVRPEKEAEQLATRQKVRQAIMAGRMTDAQQLLHNCHPDMLESVTHPNLDVLIFFHCLHYIELIRWGPTDPDCLTGTLVTCHMHIASRNVFVLLSWGCTSCTMQPYEQLSSILWALHWD